MDVLEAFLTKHPADLARRKDALKLYSRTVGELIAPNSKVPCDPERLRFHTLQMVKYHADCPEIVLANDFAFYRAPTYRAEVIAALEKQANAGKRSYGVYVNAARLCEHGAFPIPPESQAKFRRYYELDDTAPVPTRRDDARLKKAVGYYRAALTKAARGYESGSTADALANLLEKLGRSGAAVAVCQKALPTLYDISRPDFLVTYGRCLYAVKQDAKAREVLSLVRRCDREGPDHRPGCATTRAEQLLGKIALDAGDLKEAAAHLLASANVDTCCHSVTQGLPVSLARVLAETNERAAVAQFCRTVLAKFVPGDPETTALLKQAQTASAGR